MVYVLSQSRAWNRDEKVWMEKENENEYMILCLFGISWSDCKDFSYEEF